MINFPNSPTVGQTFVSAGDTWTWDGVKWTGGGAAAAAIAVQEAPEDGQQYGRQNGAWSPITATTVGIADVTAGGQYVRVTGAWQPLVLPATGIPEAPASGGPYGRQSSAWTQLGPFATAADAPTGGTVYGRSNGAWTAVPSGGIPDAPATGGPFCRVAGSWTPVPSSTGIPDAPSGGPWARTAGSRVGIGTSTGSYLPLSGGSLSGPLILNDGSTAVSQAWVAAHTPSGGNFLPLSGGVMTGPIEMASSNGITGPNGSQRILYGHTGTIARWGLVLGSSDYESGQNRGSSFILQSYGDSGAALASALTIDRASSGVNINAIGAGLPSIAYTAGQANLTINKAGSGHLANLNGMSNGVMRWQIQLGNSTAESANAGSGFVIQNFSDSGSPLSPIPLQISRAQGSCTFGLAIVNGPSDRTMKENIEPLEDALYKVRALQGVSFNMIATPGKREIGLIAQDVEPIVPEVIQPFGDEGKLALDYPKLTALLIEAVKTLSARIEALEAAR